MNHDLLDFDFNATVRDFDYTKKATSKLAQVVYSKDFEDMDVDTIFQFLKDEMEVVHFKDYLKRYIYECAELEEPFYEIPNEMYIDIIKDCFEQNRAPHSFEPTSKKWTAIVKSWLSRDSVKRNTVFLLGFGLQMTVFDVSEFLTKVLKENDFDFSDIHELIYWYCFKHGNNYDYAAKLYAEYEAMKETISIKSCENEIEELRWTDIIKRPDYLKKSKDYLTEYFRFLILSGAHEEGVINAQEEFVRLYDSARRIIASLYQEVDDEAGKKRTWTIDMIYPRDVESVLYNGIPKDGSGDLRKMSSSMLSKQFLVTRLNRHRIMDLLKGKYPVLRYDLITLQFYIYAMEVEPDWPAERYYQFIDHTNEILDKCHMMGLYPANPYEAFIMMCILCDDPMSAFSEVWEISYQEDYE